MAESQELDGVLPGRGTFRGIYASVVVLAAVIAWRLLGLVGVGVVIAVAALIYWAMFLEMYLAWWRVRVRAAESYMERSTDAAKSRLQVAVGPGSLRSRFSAWRFNRAMNLVQTQARAVHQARMRLEENEHQERMALEAREHQARMRVEEREHRARKTLEEEERQARMSLEEKERSRGDLAEERRLESCREHERLRNNNEAWLRHRPRSFDDVRERFLSDAEEHARRASAAWDEAGSSSEDFPQISLQPLAAGLLKLLETTSVPLPYKVEDGAHHRSRIESLDVEGATRELIKATMAAIRVSHMSEGGRVKTANANIEIEPSRIRVANVYQAGFAHTRDALEVVRLGKDHFECGIYTLSFYE